MTAREAQTIIDTIDTATKDVTEPLSVVVAREYHNDPFLLLISCLLSLRAKDTKTIIVVRKLFSRIQTPEQLCALPLKELEHLIYSIGFYRQKARIIKAASCDLITRFNGQVPRTKQELMSIKGAGPKTANLVLSMAFDIPAICVDVHVHRLSNLLGLVKTNTPEETELALEQLLPQSYWTKINHVLVKLGQNIKKVAQQLPPAIQEKLMPLTAKKASLVQKTFSEAW
jgi:endonuclease-3